MIRTTIEEYYCPNIKVIGFTMFSIENDESWHSRQRFIEGRMMMCDTLINDQLTK